MFLAETRLKRLRSSYSTNNSTKVPDQSKPEALSSSSDPSQRRLSKQSLGPLHADLIGRREVLNGVAICVTGLSPESKSRCHEVVEALGGSFTRHFDSSQNTHLIAQIPEGPKYDAAVSCSNVFVVKPSWLEACHQSNSRVLEKDHFTQQLSSCRDIVTNNNHKSTSGIESLSVVLNQELLLATFHDILFSPCAFLLVGFDNESLDFFQMGRFIRRCRGTIYWEMNDSISHIVVSDGCEESLRNTVRVTALQQPGRFAVVSPWWLVASWREKRLVSTEAYPPTPLTRVPTEKLASSQSKSYRRRNPKRSLPKKSSLFYGCLFVLVRVSPPSHAVDFDVSTLEQIIRSNGGQMLSLKLVEALRGDASAGQAQEFERRTCYAIAWGCYHAPTQISLHPLLAQVKRFRLAEIREVTPIWLQSCVADHQKYSPDSVPLVFRPQSWPLRRMVGTDDSDMAKKKVKGTDEKTIKIATTGFVTPERTAVVQLILAMGVVYDDTMRPTTTHLLCTNDPAPKGPKIRKALQWGLHVVAVEWLFHVAQYGYVGLHNCPSGCEDEFSVDKRLLNDSSTSAQNRDESRSFLGSQDS